MKNYYDELEISKNASKEVIERVYKVLAKKYHPDTTKESDKRAAEEKFKAISEAYEVLSNEEKREKYDLELEQQNPSISYDDYITVVNQRNFLNTSLDNLKNQFYQSNNYNYNNFNTNTTTNYTPPTKNKSKKVRYYNVATGKPVSAFTYYKYKIKQILSNIFLFVLFIVAILLALNAFSNLNLFTVIF